MVKILPNGENPDIDKFALMLLPKREGGNEEMIGFVGTNRYKEQGMEVGYVINRAYWGKGFATEGMRLFLEMYWEMPGKLHLTFNSKIQLPLIPRRWYFRTVICSIA